MLRHTFCHLPGVGARTEQRLWSADGKLSASHVISLVFLPGDRRMPRERPRVAGCAEWRG